MSDGVEFGISWTTCNGMVTLSEGDWDELQKAFDKKNVEIERLQKQLDNFIGLVQ